MRKPLTVPTPPPSRPVPVLREGNKRLPGGRVRTGPRHMAGRMEFQQVMGGHAQWSAQHSQGEILLPITLFSSSTLYSSPLLAAKSLKAPIWLCTSIWEKSQPLLFQQETSILVRSPEPAGHIPTPAPLHLLCQYLRQASLPVPCSASPAELRMLFPQPGTAFLQFWLPPQRGSTVTAPIPSPPYHPISVPPGASLSPQRLCSFTHLLAVCLSPRHSGPHVSRSVL